MIGFKDGTFRPKQPLSRAETVKALNRLFERPALEGTAQSTWKDVPLTYWASADIESASHTHTLQP
jgi:hypothetical protein